MPVDYSIIVPAYNEEAILGETLKHIKQNMQGTSLRGELIVCDNNSTDRTANIAHANGARVVFQAKNQISRARNTGAKHAEGRYLIFIDADSIASTALLQTALDRLESDKICGGGACVELDKTPLPASRRILNVWNWLSRTLNLAAGCFIYCRRDDFKAVGGFNENIYASEEIWFSKKLKRRGKKQGRKFSIINQPKVITSARKQEWYSPRYHLGLILMMTFFPFLVRFRKACEYWYRRPENKDLK